MNIISLPSEMGGVRQEGSRIETVPMVIKGQDGKLPSSARFNAQLLRL